MSTGAPNKGAMPNPNHCCNSGMFHGASPRCFPYTTVCQLKVIPLLLDAGTSSFTRIPQQADGIFPHLTHGHTGFTAQV